MTVTPWLLFGVLAGVLLWLLLVTAVVMTYRGDHSRLASRVGKLQTQVSKTGRTRRNTGPIPVQKPAGATAASQFTAPPTVEIPRRNAAPTTDPIVSTGRHAAPPSWGSH